MKLLFTACLALTAFASFAESSSAATLRCGDNFFTTRRVVEGYDEFHAFGNLPSLLGMPITSGTGKISVNSDGSFSYSAGQPYGFGLSLVPHGYDGGMKLTYKLYNGRTLVSSRSVDYAYGQCQIQQ